VLWEDRLLALFDDLELQAEGLALADRDAEVAELSRAEYSQVDLAARLHGSVGRSVTVRVHGVGPLHAVLSRVGADWCLLTSQRQEWIVRLQALAAVAGVADRALAAEARPLAARLPLGSALRHAAETGSEVAVYSLQGGVSRRRLRRVGADFVELAAEPGEGQIELLPFTALAAVRRS
jgi:hypothetical protein